MPKTQWDWMAYVATIGGQFAFIYELVDICRKGEGDKLSWPFTIMAMVASMLGLAYGLRNQLTPLVITGIVDVILSIALIIIKILHKDKYVEKIDEL